MKFKHRVAAILTGIALILGMGAVAAPAAQAGNGTGYICNNAYSHTYIYGNLDVYGRGTWQPIAPGQCRGGAGFDLDAVFVPGNMVTSVTFNGFGTGNYNRCGRTGFWTKVSDWGAMVISKRC